jgi:hypothetical protein
MIFAYDASRQRVKTVKPDGTIVYTPFGTYEEEVASGGTTTERSYYLLGGQMVALRVESDPGDTDDGLYFIHTDHLGSTSLLTDDAGDSVDTMIRYYPFGDYRTAPTADLTDRGFTGHRENMELGLVYMNAGCTSLSLFLWLFLLAAMSKKGDDNVPQRPL